MVAKYGLIKAKQPEFPVKDLLIVPHQGGILTVAHPAFGANTYLTNIKEMQKSYSHPVTGKKITFRPATTAESISAVAYKFGSGGEVDAKRDILDPRWLQIGYIVRTAEGVYANPPKDKEGNPIIDEETLMSLLDKGKAEEFEGIRLCENGFGFAPYKTFRQGVQSCDDFARRGLAKLLEQAKGKTALNLKEIASPKNYKLAVNVFGFDKVKEPVLRVASLDSYSNVDSNRLNVDGNSWDDNYCGCAFGVLE